MSSFLMGAANGRERFRQQGEKMRADEGRRDELAEAQRAFEEAQAARLAQYKAATGPQTTPEQRTEQADQRSRTIAAIRHLQGQITQERRHLSAEVEDAVAKGDLERALAAQARIGALGPIEGIAGRQLTALGADGHARPWSPLGVR